MKEIKLNELNIPTETMHRLNTFVKWYIEASVNFELGIWATTSGLEKIANKLYDLRLIPKPDIYYETNMTDPFFRVDITILQSFKAFGKIGKLINRKDFAVTARSKERLPFWVNKSRKKLEQIYGIK